MSPLELRLRLIFLFRLLKVDTVVCYDPWSQYEENPDHCVTASAVEAACWMAGMAKDYPEHFEAGLAPHGVSEKYYFARGPQLVNRVVDTSALIEQKISMNILNAAQGPAGQRERNSDSGCSAGTATADPRSRRRDGEPRVYAAVRAGSGRGDREAVRPGVCRGVSLYRTATRQGRRIRANERRTVVNSGIK